MKKVFLLLAVLATFGCRYKSTWVENKTKRDYLNDMGYYYRKVASHYLKQDNMDFYLQYSDSAKICFQMADSIQIFHIDKRPKINTTTPNR